MTRGVVRNPQDWIRDPRIAEVARASGWDDATGDLTLLGAIIAIESSGNTLSRSGDGCVGLTQFHRIGNHALFDRSHWGDDIQGVFDRFGIERPQRGRVHEASWYNDPRASIIYTGFVLQDNLQQLRGERRGNLLLALQGYNGGTNDLRTPGAVESEAREYPERVAAYLDYQARHGATAEIRRSNAATLARLLEDAGEVGQRQRIVDGIAQYRQHMINNEAAMNRQATGAEPIRTTNTYTGAITPTAYLSQLIAGRGGEVQEQATPTVLPLSESDRQRLEERTLGGAPRRSETFVGWFLRVVFGISVPSPAAPVDPIDAGERAALGLIPTTGTVHSVHAAIIQNPNILTEIQRALGISDDGLIGPQTRGAWRDYERSVAAAHSDIIVADGKMTYDEVELLFTQRNAAASARSV